MPVTKVRTGRPPLGQVAMTAVERQRRRRAALKSGEAAGRKKEPVAAHPQKSNHAIAAETVVAFKTVARASASGAPNDTPEKTIGLVDGKSYPEGRPKIRIPNNWAPRRYQRNVWRYLEQGGKRAICIWHRRAGKDEICLHWAAASGDRSPPRPTGICSRRTARAARRSGLVINPHTGKRRQTKLFPHEPPRQHQRVGKCLIRLKNGATWQVVGSDRYDAAVGSSPAGITFSGVGAEQIHPRGLVSRQS